jgi:alpha-ketoglutarate-dependent taurine dioxygenase
LILVSQRGVVFFRAQDNLSNELQKQLVQRMGELTGKPADSKLHIHPILNNTSEFGVDDAEISTISSQQRKQLFKLGGNKAHRDPRTSYTAPGARKYDSAAWHSDIQFEPAPADYTSLRLTQLPPTGGDTLWGSGYEVYDRFSRGYQGFLEGLTATFEGEGFTRAARENPDRIQIFAGPRGSPVNVGTALTAVHPVVRTNPVTGWKSVYPIGPFPKYINELNVDESDELLRKLLSVLSENHDLQVRFKWRNVNDIGKCSFSFFSIFYAPLVALAQHMADSPLLCLIIMVLTCHGSHLG